MTGIEIRLDEQAFFRFSRECGYLPGETKYLNLSARAAVNPLFSNGPEEFWVVLRDGKTVFRALTGYDRRFQAQTGKKWGYFSLFEGTLDTEAGAALLDQILKRQRAWGCDAIVGPLSPDGSGFFHGLGLDESASPFQTGTFSRGTLTGPARPFAEQILLSGGFQKLDEDYAYLIRVPDENKDREMAIKASKRFSVEVQKLRPSAFREAWKRIPAQIAPEGTKADFLREMERIRPFLNVDFSFACMRGSECLGYLLSVTEPHAPLRLSTLMTRDGCFQSPAVLLLISAAMDQCIRYRVPYVEASVIHDENVASRRLVERFGGLKIRRYCRYYKNIEII